MKIVITSDNFKDFVLDAKIALVKFGAEWCGPCKAMEPILDELAAEYDGRANICVADVEQCPDLAAQFRIRNVPTTLFFKSGELKDKAVGGVAKDTLAEKLDALL